MNEVEKCAKILGDLQDQRDVLLGRVKTLGQQRETVSYSAHTGNKDAKAKLDRINIEASTIGHDIVSIEAAIAEAEKRLRAAQQDEASTADQEKAKQIVDLNTKLSDELTNADDALADFIGSILTARTLLQDMHALGIASPNDTLFRINAVVAIKTALQKLPNHFVNDFEFARLAPSQKKEFKALATGWCDQIARQIAARLEEDKKERAA